jgi:hypothetical protein
MMDKTTVEGDHFCSLPRMGFSSSGNKKIPTTSLISIGFFYSAYIGLTTKKNVRNRYSFGISSIFFFTLCNFIKLCLMCEKVESVTHI